MTRSSARVVAVLAAALFIAHPASAQWVLDGATLFGVIQPVVSTTTGVADPAPLRFASFRAEPQPVRLLFSIASVSPVSVGMFDASGRRVRRLSEGTFAPGRHAVVWDGLDDDGRELPPGVYEARTIRKGGTETTRLVRLGAR